MLKHIQEKLRFVIYKIKQTTIERSPQGECVVLKTLLFTQTYPALPKQIKLQQNVKAHSRETKIRNL